MKIFFPLQMLSVFFISCKKENTETPSTIQFNGITPTDVDGNFIGQKDTTDWGFQMNWEERAFAFFNDERRPGCDNSEAYEAYAATPNPTPDEINLGFWLLDSSDLEIRIVDKNFNLLKSIDFTNALGINYNSVTIDLSDIELKDTVRLYYKIIDEDCELRGSGVVVIQ